MKDGMAAAGSEKAVAILSFNPSIILLFTTFHATVDDQIKFTAHMTQSHSILCFGIAREITGSATITLHLRSRPKVLELRSELLTKYPAFGELVSFAIARNEAYADDNETLEPGDTLAIIPPVSGG